MQIRDAKMQVFRRSSQYFDSPIRRKKPGNLIWSQLSQKKVSARSIEVSPGKTSGYFLPLRSLYLIEVSIVIVGKYRGFW